MGAGFHGRPPATPDDPSCSPPTCTCSPAHLAVELCDQLHAVGEEEAGQILLVQARLLIHWEVCPALVKLDNTGWVSRTQSPEPDPCLGLNSALTHLLEEDHSVLGEAESLKELWPVSEAKGHVQSIPGQGQEGSHILILQILRGPCL